MSDLLNKASLVVIPSGYKEDTVYSVVPSDGSGDLSFTRASNGTRVNSAGLVEVTPWNMVSYSEQFDNAYWTKVDCTVTADSTTAPNGTSTADSLLDNTSNFIHALTPALSKATTEITYTHSVYAKFKDTDRKIQLSLDDAVSGGVDSGVFNLSTGVWDTALGTPSAAFTNPSRNFENIGNGWYRISLTVTSNAGSQIRPNIFVINGSNASLYIGNGTGIYIWGAQLNIGSTAKPYFPTTDRLNVPRLTYQNGGGGCPSLLLEKQSTNLVTYSEQINSTNYTLNNVTSSENSLTSPDGTINADKIIENTSNSTHSVNRVVALGGTVDNSAYSVSVFAKAEGRSQILFYDNNQNVGGITYFNLSTGVVSSGTGKIENFGNGWYRCTIFCLKDNSTNANLQFYLLDSAGNSTYTGNGTSGIGLWGYQVEASSYPTSYIPTTSASATRVADACYKTGISSLIGQTEGTMFLDFIFKPQANNTDGQIGISDGANSNRVVLWNNFTLNTLGLQLKANGTNQISNVSLGSFVDNTRYKIAVAYKSGNTSVFVNGIEVIANTATFTFSSALTDFILGGYELTYSGHQQVNESVLFKTRLTNAELASLTTL
jgi:hypothetical protein